MSTSIIISLFILTTVLATSVSHPNPLIKEKEKVLTVVEGMQVYCQSCSHIGSWSLAGARPLPSAKVAITCKNYKNRVRFYKAVKADDNGYFYCPLDGLNIKKYYIGDIMNACTLRLLSSPNVECNTLTNINGGIEGSKLRDSNKTVVGKGYEAAVYAAGPLAFRPNLCAPLIHY